MRYSVFRLINRHPGKSPLFATVCVTMAYPFYEGSLDDVVGDFYSEIEGYEDDELEHYKQLKNHWKDLHFPFVKWFPIVLFGTDAS